MAVNTSASEKYGEAKSVAASNAAKPGIKSSEWWLAIVAGMWAVFAPQVLPQVEDVGGQLGDAIMGVGSQWGPILLAMVHAIMRGMVKRAALS